MSALSVRNLSKAYGGVQAVRDVSFRVAPGEVVAMIGPSRRIAFSAWAWAARSRSPRPSAR
jgi:ABC-type phosphonate transport system ATPase subunit